MPRQNPNPNPNPNPDPKPKPNPNPKPKPNQAGQRAKQGLEEIKQEIEEGLEGVAAAILPKERPQVPVESVLTLKPEP